MSLERLHVPEAETKARLTPYQLSQLVLFPGFITEKGRYHMEQFAGLGGALKPEESWVLEHFSKEVINKNIGFNQPNDGFNGLEKLAKGSRYTEVAKIFKRIGKLATLTMVGKSDIEEEKLFNKLPRMVKFAIVLSGKDVFDQIREFLSSGGIISHVEFKKPAPDYLAAIDNSPGDTTLGKIASALTISEDKEKDNSNRIKDTSHEFINIFFIPSQEQEYDSRERYNPAHLSEILNRRLDDKVEDDYARMILTKLFCLKKWKRGLLQ